MNNFDRFIAIDWSGAERPVFHPGISIASCTQGRAAPVLDTRQWSRASVADWIETLSSDNHRTLIGIDCNFSYGQETARLQFGQNYTAFDLWDAVEQACRGQNNYFAGNYWSHENNARYFWASGKRPETFVASPRVTEAACRRLKLGNPESPFKLIGAKQVGKGGLSGMRLLRDLKNRLGRKLAIWPFDDNSDDAAIVMAEIYPRLFLVKAGLGNRKIQSHDHLNRALDYFQSDTYSVRAIFSDHDSDALVSAAGLRYLCKNGAVVPEKYAFPQTSRDILMREGWIFGVA